MSGGSEPAALDPRLFRRALGTFVTGVTIITTVDPDGMKKIGVTANSFSSLSLDPPMLLWSLARNAYSMAAFRAAERFVVHVLAADQLSVSERFAAKGTDKFAGTPHDVSPEGLPLLRNCLARFECRKAMTHEGGDHLIFVGLVERFAHSDGPPLTYYGGRYAQLQLGEAADMLLALQSW